MTKINRPQAVLRRTVESSHGSMLFRDRELQLIQSKVGERVMRLCISDLLQRDIEEPDISDVHPV